MTKQIAPKATEEITATETPQKKSETTFEDIGLSSKTLEGLSKKGFKFPSPIQAAVIPLLLNSKKNIIGQASTGTGKTAAFGIPLIEKLTPKGYPQALILTPTRELAVQVCEEIASLQTQKNLSLLPIYGGQSYDIQNRALKRGVDIIVGTPGRVIDHLKRKTLDIGNISYFILDEADEMLNMGFVDDIELIFKQTSPDKKVLLFSATMPNEILKVAKKYMGEYELISAKNNQLTTTQTEQFYLQIHERDKLDALCRIMDKEVDFYGIIFCKTKLDTDHIFSKLHEKGYSVQALHGDIQQKQRETILKLFKGKKINILVATDVASRGIDVNDITHVINYSLPQDPESYIHRVGRTGRAGKTGIAITLISPSEFKKFLFFQKAVKTDIKKMEVPTIEHVIDNKKKQLKNNIIAKITDDSFQKNLALAEEILLEQEAKHIVAALLTLAYGNDFNPNNYWDIQQASYNNPGNSYSWGNSYGWGSYGGRSDKIRMFLALGKKDGFHTKALLDHIVEMTSIPSREIDDIMVLNDFSFATIPDLQSEIFLKTFKDKASIAKGKPGDKRGGDRGGDRGDRGGDRRDYGRNRDNNRRNDNKPNYAWNRKANNYQKREKF